MSDVECVADIDDKDQKIEMLRAEYTAIRKKYEEALCEINDLRMEICDKNHEMDFMRGKIEAYEYALKVQGGRK